MFGELLLITAVGLIAYSFYKWATINNDFFEKRNIKYCKPTFLVGNTAALFLKKYTAFEFAKLTYNRFPDEPIYGMFDFRVPNYVVRDVDAIKQVTIKAFDHFEDHRPFFPEGNDDLFGNSLFMMRGEKWREMRATLSPAFTGSKMRQMFQLVSECGIDLVKHLTEKAEQGERINFEMKDFFSRYTVDVVASCAFGIKVNSTKNPENDFYKNGTEMMNFTGFKQIIRFFLNMKMPMLARILGVKLFKPSVAQEFKSLIMDTMEVRKNENIYRPDMINILMQVREGSLLQQLEEKSNDDSAGFATVEESKIGKVSVSRKWTDNELVAQCFVFFLAGFETTSTMLTIASYELMANPDVQKKLYEEITETNEQIGGKPITYDVLQKMKYLDQVICEALRKWPPAAQTDRICVKDYVFDDGRYKFQIEKGTTVVIPICGLHHDEKYFPNPDKFDPERFSDENKDTIVPGTYIPFGVGPRNCVGSRFALMELKAILYYLLLNFSFEANEKTDIPIQFIKSAMVIKTVNGMHLELKPRPKQTSI